MVSKEIFKALGSKTRLDILKILSKEEMHLSGIAREIGISKPAISKHLNILESVGLIERKTFGNTHVFNSNFSNLYTSFEYFKESLELDISRGKSVLDVLKNISGVEVKKMGEKEFITSIDGEQGYYLYEVDGRVPDVPIGEYILEKDSKVKIKKLLPVSKKEIDIQIK